MRVEEILKKLVSFQTVTPNECGIYAWIMDFLGDQFVWERMDCGEVKNLFGYKDFAPTSSKKIHLCFAGHIDVVPAGDGWESDPFEAIVKEGYLYGRGTQDMKGGIAAFLSAISECDLQNCDLIVSVLLTSDEEGEAINGTRFVLEELKKRDFLPDIAIVAEPTSQSKIADAIKVGRRGSINGILEIEGIQGHVAYPQKCLNPIELLGARLGEIAGVNLDEGDEHFEPSKIVVTDIRGGLEVCNVTPSHLRLMFNVRNSTQSDEQTLRSYLERVLEGLSYTLKLTTSSRPFLTQSRFFEILSQSAKKITGYSPSSSTSGGTSDARYFAAYGVEVLELGGLNDRIHAKNERVKIADLEILQKIFLDFLFSVQGGK
ncbi:succinyl-diaminopimelate desuccinylase [Helicobacter pametensis]|uniref:succinyl-diaminopimelate desuccinylase n=1 Tax=Helicobacter pametensis TaxID=95149 RepID=UPI000482E4FD|nr:succinyl-diaminopimelate desuccinylase [Helicobacter pametensis]